MSETDEEWGRVQKQSRDGGRRRISNRLRASERAGAVAHGTESGNCGVVAQTALWLPSAWGQSSSSDATIQDTDDPRSIFARPLGWDLREYSH